MSNGTILYIGGFELPDKNAAAHRVLSNGKILKELGYNVVFVGVDKSLSHNSDVLDTKIEIQGFDCWSLYYPQEISEWAIYLSSINNIIKVASKYSDVKMFIAYNYPAINLYRLKRFCNKNCYKIIADCTEWYSTKGSSLIFKVIKGMDSFLRMRIIQKNLDGIIVISVYLERYYHKVKNVICLPPLVDKQESKWNMNFDNNSDSKIRLVYAGSLGRNKDHLGIILDTLAKTEGLPSYIFYVIGITKKEYLSEYPSHVKIIERLKENVIFLGRLPHIKSLEYVKKSNFSLFIRDNTRMTKAGFPTKFVESISCGTPVITSKSSDLYKYITIQTNGYFIDMTKFQDSLTEAFQYMSQYNIINKDQDMDTNIFDFRNYLKTTNEFIDQIIKD